jgi:hypothetical protein
MAKAQLIPRSGPFAEDVGRFFRDRQEKRTSLSIVRERVPLADVRDQTEVKHTSAHLARLWANEETLKLCSSRKPDADKKAVELATQYQLVTPRTGAVVLETAEQFQRHGLTPASPASVPTIPEPEVWMLMAVVLFLLVFIVYRRRTWLPA